MLPATTHIFLYFTTEHGGLARLTLRLVKSPVAVPSVVCEYKKISSSRVTGPVCSHAESTLYTLYPVLKQSSEEILRQLDVRLYVYSRT